MTQRHRAIWVLALAAAMAPPATADEPPSPRAVMDRLAKSNPADAGSLAADLVALFGKQALAEGPQPKVEELSVLWAIESPGAKALPSVVFEDGPIQALGMSRIGDTDVYAVSGEFAEGYAARWAYEVDGKRTSPARGRQGHPQPWAELEVYRTPPEALERSDVPKGKLTPMPTFESRVFDGTTRDWWIYVPAQYDGSKPACVMVFQDGQWYKDFIPTAFDNLIAKGEMPVTVGVFIAPGTFEGGRPNRSFEYDTLSDQYARFLLQEILPEVEKTAKLRRDAAGRGIAGISSGGICAWTVAWERPEEFSKVLSWVGSFTNIASGPSRREGGHNYPALIRKAPRKPIRVFLQDGARDLDNEHGDWPLANLQMAKALAFKDYDYRFVYGQGFHSNKHGRAVLPDSLRWLWRDEVGGDEPSQK
jgi:enterochelin esterase family protein